jgi:enterochelin esterase-like enzyme
MSRPLAHFIFPLFLLHFSQAVEPEFPLTEDSKAQIGTAKGTLLKESYSAKEGSVFPGTQREYQIYLPAGFDKTKPAAFMVFQDGVIYQAPIVFDNLIAKKDIPPLVGIFIKPGVVPAANENALPRFNRSYEYDSMTPTYSQFLIDEFLPAIEAKHGLKLSTDPNHAAISGNSSGGICAFMVAWHRPDRFRRVFTGVGTYVGIRGADRLPVLVRKIEPKPLRIFLQSGTGDNNLYCGDWWMANQMMERSLTWAGYDVNHAWGEGGHNQKHASQIFPDVLRWLWRGWQTDLEVKVNPKGESRWRGDEVVGKGDWEKTTLSGAKYLHVTSAGVVSPADKPNTRAVNQHGARFDAVLATNPQAAITLSPDQTQVYFTDSGSNYLYAASAGREWQSTLQPFVQLEPELSAGEPDAAAATGLCVDTRGWIYVATSLGVQVCDQAGRVNFIIRTPERPLDVCFGGHDLADLYIACGGHVYKRRTLARGVVSEGQSPIKPAPPKL